MVTKLVSPLRVSVSANKHFTLNLSIYRNTHFQTLNKAKKTYKELMTPQIQQLNNLTIKSIEYVLYPKTRRLTDLDNVCSIHSKFFQDALVELGKLPDDNYNYIPKLVYSFGSIDSGNPRVEILITE